MRNPCLCGTYVARGRSLSWLKQCGCASTSVVSWGFWLERAKGIEPS